MKFQHHFIAQSSYKPSRTMSNLITSFKKKTSGWSTNGGLMKLDPASMTAIKQVHKTENEKETFS